MGSKSRYIGIESYVKGRDRSKKIMKISGALLILCISLVGLTIAYNYLFKKSIEYKKINIEIKDSEILKYIEIVDDVVKEGRQINWKEVAAVYGTINSGNFKINENEIIEIAQRFYECEGFKSIDEIVKEFSLQNKEDKFYGYLYGLEDIALNKEISTDNNKRKFVEKLEKEAEKNFHDFGILPSVTMAQAILESGWGKSELAIKYNNLFGIKADKRWDGAIATIKTKENYDDEIKANFRKYDNINESILDHGEFLAENKRYGDAGLFEGENYIKQAQALEDAGYSTSKDEDGNPIYADKLIRVIRQNNLMIYDSKILRNR